MTDEWVNDEFLVCRDLMHAWKPETARQVVSGFVRTMRCLRCSSVKRQTLDEYGYITGSSIRYVKGYLMPPGGGRLSQNDKALLRLEMWERDVFVVRAG